MNVRPLCIGLVVALLSGCSVDWLGGASKYQPEDIGDLSKEAKDLVSAAMTGIDPELFRTAMSVKRVHVLIGHLGKLFSGDGFNVALFAVVLNVRRRIRLIHLTGFFFGESDGPERQVWLFM